MDKLWKKLTALLLIEKDVCSINGNMYYIGSICFVGKSLSFLRSLRLDVFLDLMVFIVSSAHFLSMIDFIVRKAHGDANVGNYALYQVIEYSYFVFIDQVHKNDCLQTNNVNKTNRVLERILYSRIPFVF